MQTFFKVDPNLSEVIDSVIEKTIMISILSGQGCTSDIQKVKNSLQKLIRSLQETTFLSLPELKDGVKQMLEQRLPDARIIEHIPGFFPMLDTLIEETLVQCAGPEKEPGLPDQVAEDEVAEDELAPVSACLTVPASSFTAWAEELIPPQAIGPEALPIPEKSEFPPEKKEAENVKAGTADIEATKATEETNDVKEIQEAPKIKDLRPRLTRTSSTPPEGERLALLLKLLYKGSPIRWNMSLAGYTAFAQVDNLLIFVQEEDHRSEILRTFKDQGWVIAFCRREDLSFPRRLERIIHLSLHSERSCKN